MINCRKSSILISLLFYLASNSFSEPPLKSQAPIFHPHPKKKRPFFRQLIKNWLTKINWFKKIELVWKKMNQRLKLNYNIYMVNQCSETALILPQAAGFRGHLVGIYLNY